MHFPQHEIPAKHQNKHYAVHFLWGGFRGSTCPPSTSKMNIYVFYGKNSMERVPS
jgi:hypothetical protein